MTLAENKLIVRRAASIWDTRDFDLLYELYHENSIHHQQSNHHNVTFQGLDKWPQQMEGFLVKYPDYKEKTVS